MWFGILFRTASRTVFEKINFITKMATKKKKSAAAYGIIGVSGDNFVVKDTPCLIPKENMKMFHTMQKQSSVSSFGDFPNPFNSFWNGKK